MNLNLKIRKIVLPGKVNTLQKFIKELINNQGATQNLQINFHCNYRYRYTMEIFSSNIPNDRNIMWIILRQRKNDYVIIPEIICKIMFSFVSYVIQL